MGFFDPVPRPDEHQPASGSDSPAWHGPPANVLPGVAPVELVLAASDRFALGLRGMWVYPSGISFALSVRTNLHTISHRQSLQELRAIRFLHGARWDRDDRAMLRFGVQFADGRKATNPGPEL
jgi:hypothetical protein